MPSKCVTAVVAVDQEVFTAPLNKICSITGIQAPAAAGAGTITIKIRLQPRLVMVQQQLVLH